MRIHRDSRGLLPFLVMACCISAAPAQTAAPSPVAPEQSTLGYRISGRVVDEHSGGALSRCTVEIVETKRGVESHTLVTGEDGRFSFEHLPAAKYRLSASGHGFLTQSYEQHDNYSTAIAVGPGLASEDLVFRLTPGAIISGAVTDDSGAPVRGALLKLFRDEDSDGIRATQQQALTNTDDRGFYEMADIRPGAYFLSVSAQPWYARRQPTQAGSSPDEAALDVAYPTTYYPDVTDADTAAPIPVNGGERLQADFVLHAERAMHLRIPISMAEQQRSGHGISISQSVFGQPENVSGYTMSSDDSGAMEIDGLLPGHYDMDLTTNSEGHQATAHFSADISEGSSQISDTQNNPEIAVTGRVISSEGKLPHNSAVMLLTRRNRRAYNAPVNDAGEFSVSVPPGAYEVIGQIRQHYLGTISATGARLTGRILTVNAGADPHLEISVGNSYGQIDGIVMHDRHPASAAMVLLVPDHPRENQILFRRDQSDSDGTFTLPGILPGHYRLVAIERGWELEWANPRVLAPFLVKAQPVEVKGSDHLQGSVELQTR